MTGPPQEIPATMGGAQNDEPATAPAPAEDGAAAPAEKNNAQKRRREVDVSELPDWRDYFSEEELKVSRFASVVFLRW